MSKPGSVFVVVIGDMVRSRRLPRARRARIQGQLEKLFLQINRNHKKSVVTPFQFTAGDEFQGVLKTAFDLFPVIHRIRDTTSPVSVRFGIGIGSITTAISKQPQAMDGPAFHRARDALERAQEFIGQICLSSGKREEDEVVNAWLDVLSFIRSTWSERRREIIRLYDDFDKLEPVASKLGISVQAVSKHLQVTGYKAYVRGEKVLGDLLSRLCPRSTTIG